MYQRVELELQSVVIGDPMCLDYSPDGKCVCTLDKNHRGYHKAGVTMHKIVAYWDDHRETDPQKEDFFASIGL